MATATKHPPAESCSTGFQQRQRARGNFRSGIQPSRIGSGVHSKTRGICGFKDARGGQHTQTVDTARVAVLAAINIADEYHLSKGNFDPAP